MKQYKTPSVYLVGPASERIQIHTSGSDDGIAGGLDVHLLASKLEEE